MDQDCLLEFPLLSGLVVCGLISTIIRNGESVSEFLCLHVFSANCSRRMLTRNDKGVFSSLLILILSTSYK